MPDVALFTDNHVRGPLIKALRERGWDVVRAVDIFGERNDDAELFAYAAREGRVFLTCDEGIQDIARDWLAQGRTDFRMIFCSMERQQSLTVGDLLRAVEGIIGKPSAFAYPVEFVKPPSRAGG